MKNLQSTLEGAWVELKQVELTEAQKTILFSNDNEAKATLFAEIKANREVKATKADKDLAVAKYTEVKPILEETDVYELVAVDITIENASVSGILNYRVNGEHKQIRF
jgi:hypothetical protein